MSIRYSTSALASGLLIWLALASPSFAMDDCDDEEWISFAGWEDWAAITEKPVISYAHGENWVGIYANEIAAQTYLDVGPLYDECAAIVKAVYTDIEGTSVLRLTLMVKMPAGYDPGHGDWWYGASESTGTVIGESGRREDCRNCHEVARETDYVFSDDVMETVREWREWAE